MLDVSEGGLCLLSPVALRSKQEVTLEIDVPPNGPVTVEALAWHVRKLKSATAPSFSIGMMISKAGEGFRALLPVGDARAYGVEEVSAALEEIASRAPEAPAGHDLLDDDASSASTRTACSRRRGSCYSGCASRPAADPGRARSP